MALKAGDGKLYIDKLVYSPRSFNILKTKVDDLGVDKLKTVTEYLKKLSQSVVAKIPT